MTSSFAPAVVRSVARGATLGFFSPDTFRLVMQALNPVIIAVVATVFANVAFVIRRIARAKRAVLLVCLLLVSYLAGVAFFRDIDRLEDINDTAAVDITQLAVWESFSAAMKSGGDDMFARADRTERLDIASQTPHIRLEDAVRSGRYRIVDVLCLNSPVRGSERRCQLSWDLYSNFNDRGSVDRIMRAYGYGRETPLLFYCQEGFTSSRLAFILNAYGYRVAWAKLSDVTDPTIIDAAFEPRIHSDVVIEPLRFSDRRRYTYFLFEFDDQNAFAYNEIFTSKAPALRTYRRVGIVQVPNTYDRRLLTQAGLEGLVVRAQDADVARLARNDIICRNRLHCYLTRIYLASLEVTPAKSLLCVRCEDES